MTWTTIRNALASLFIALGMSLGTANLAVADGQDEPDYEDGAHPTKAEDAERDPANPQGYGERAAE